MTRRDILYSAGLAAAFASFSPNSVQAMTKGWEATFPEPVTIKSIRLLSYRSNQFCEVTAALEGKLVSGLVWANDRIAILESVLEKLVAPLFVGKDARQIEALLDEIYQDGRTYKFAGMPLWNPVANVELAILDLLGRVAQQPTDLLFNSRVRQEVSVYISRFDRASPAEQEIAKAKTDLEKTGAKATKLKVGLRMTNSPAQSARDRQMTAIAKERLGEDVTVYLDANGSYTAQEGIEMGRHFQQAGIDFLEEPCRWQDYEATRQVAQALDMLVVGGEQDHSLEHFRMLARTGTLDALQPDLYYNGGFIRLRRVAEVAAEFGLNIIPHTPRTGSGAAPLLQAIAGVKSLGPYVEYKVAPEIKAGRVAIPSKPGFGGEELLSTKQRQEAKVWLEVNAQP